MGSFLLKAVPDPNIDPYHRWLPGIYNITMGKSADVHLCHMGLDYEYLIGRVMLRVFLFTLENNKQGNFLEF